jgi:hypothetical protein
MIITTGKNGLRLRNELAKTLRPRAPGLTGKSWNGKLVGDLYFQNIGFKGHEAFFIENLTLLSLPQQCCPCYMFYFQ